MDIDTFNKKLDEVKLEFENEFKTRVADRTPVRTGALQASWVWDRSEQLHVFTSLMTYAGYVENGTPKMAPRMMVATTLLEGDDILRTAASRVGLT